MSSWRQKGAYAFEGNNEGRPVERVRPIIVFILNTLVIWVYVKHWDYNQVVVTEKWSDHVWHIPLYYVYSQI